MTVGEVWFAGVVLAILALLFWVMTLPPVDRR
jgi:hypothetical protein